MKENTGVTLSFLINEGEEAGERAAREKKKRSTQTMSVNRI